MGQLSRRAKAIEEAGAQLTLIGQATPRHAAHFRRTQKLELPILADEERASYRAAGLKRGGASELLAPSVVASGIAKSLRTGKVQGRPVGDMAQLGGVYVIAPGGRVVWSHVSKDAADNPDADELVERVRD